jgi:hypothetical protein
MEIERTKEMIETGIISGQELTALVKDSVLVEQDWESDSSDNRWGTEIYLHKPTGAYFKTFTLNGRWSSAFVNLRRVDGHRIVLVRPKKQMVEITEYIEI